MSALDNCRHHKNPCHRTPLRTVISLSLVFLCAGQAAYAGLISDIFGPSEDKSKPSIDEVDFSYTWKHTTKEDERNYGFSSTFHVVVVATLRNRSTYYLRNISLSCSFYDANRNQLVKDEAYFLHAESFDIAPGNAGTWTFGDNRLINYNPFYANADLTNAASAECKISGVEGGK